MAVEEHRTGMLIWSLTAPIVILVLVVVLAFLAARYKRERAKRKKYEKMYGKLLPKAGTTNTRGKRFPEHIQTIQLPQLKPPTRITLEDLEDFDDLDDPVYGHYFCTSEDDIARKSGPKKLKERIQAAFGWK